MACVTPIAVRCEPTRWRGSGARPAGCSRCRRPEASRGRLVTAFFLIPDLGVDQLLGFAAASLFAAVLVVALAERMAVAAVVAALAVAGAGAAAVALAPEAGGTLSGAAGAELVSALSHARLGDRAGRARPARGHRHRSFGSSSRRTRSTTGCPSWRMRTPLPAVRQLAPECDVHRRAAPRPGSPTRTSSTSRRRTTRRRGTSSSSGSAPARPRSGCCRTSPTCSCTRSRSTQSWPRWRTTTSRCPGTNRGSRSTSATAGASSPIDDERWDVIVIDAFFADAILFHLVTREFLQLAQTRLNPGGVIVTNAIGAIAGPGSRLFRSMDGTYRTVFPTVLVYRRSSPEIRVTRRFRNLILVATEQAAPQRVFSPSAGTICVAATRPRRISGRRSSIAMTS